MTLLHLQTPQHLPEGALYCKDIVVLLQLLPEVADLEAKDLGWIPRGTPLVLPDVWPDESPGPLGKPRRRDSRLGGSTTRRCARGWRRRRGRSRAAGGRWEWGGMTTLPQMKQVKGSCQLIGVDPWRPKALRQRDRQRERSGRYDRRALHQGKGRGCHERWPERESIRR